MCRAAVPCADAAAGAHQEEGVLHAALLRRVTCPADPESADCEPRRDRPAHYAVVQEAGNQDRGCLQRRRRQFGEDAELPRNSAPTT